MRTSLIGVPSGNPDRSTAARIATPPRVVAGVSESAPPNLPIGVRAALTMKTWPLRPASWSTISGEASARPWEPEIDLRGPGVRPALRDDLRPRVELNPLGAIHVK